MRRLFWLGMGTTMGALAMRRLSRVAERLTPQGVAGSLAEALHELAGAIGEFGADVRAAAAEREAELRAQTGLTAPLPSSARLHLPAARGVPAVDR
ncbi:hypothetical protein DQ238_16815 [Geodermatophilus sp. TF02-6]|uniref:hypothetical protein n=1 Tax=Geodermatophilus sp. TF02-6 TaxID=2250575 RepID=UPI000DE83CAD|nr:hypothetical protein [Geodermatophilus sp. TF02-6]RBY76730.1 hypothetical protein DQ238_16815 [Geodermatophilus sp. TF02-6]